MPIIGDTYLSILNKTLDGLWSRQEAISDNLANYETPNYKTKTVSFEASLKNAINGSGSKADIDKDINESKIVLEEDNTANRADDNGVDLEDEQVKMIRTAYQYMYTQRITSDYFSRLSTVIKEGK